MARVLIVHDDRPELFVELTGDDEANWDGPCSDPACDFTVSEGGTRFTQLDDAVHEAMVHIDVRH